MGNYSTQEDMSNSKYLFLRSNSEISSGDCRFAPMNGNAGVG